MPVIAFENLIVNQPVEVPQPDGALDPLLAIDVNPDKKKMPVGTYTFRLVVTDESKNESAPFDFQVTVFDEGRPVAHISGPPRVPVGKGFRLTGEKSSDPEGGRLTNFSWVLISTP